MGHILKVEKLQNLQRSRLALSFGWPEISKEGVLAWKKLEISRTSDGKESL
jgi:hypothetical protein